MCIRDSPNSDLPASPRPLLENAVHSRPGQGPDVPLPGGALQDWTRSSSGHWALAVSAQSVSPTSTCLFLRISFAMCVPSNLYTDGALHETMHHPTLHTPISALHRWRVSTTSTNCQPDCYLAQVLVGIKYYFQTYYSVYPDLATPTRVQLHRFHWH